MSTTTTNDKNLVFISDLEQVLDHLWDSEKRDCEICEEAGREGHIFTALQTVRHWLDENRTELLRDPRYNGWSNHGTWAVNLWLNDTEEDYLYWRDAARQCQQRAKTHHWVQGGTSTAAEAARYLLADQLREEVTDAYLPHVCNLPADLLSAALSEVDWHEVANAFLEDLAGYDQIRAKDAKMK